MASTEIFVKGKKGPPPPMNIYFSGGRTLTLVPSPAGARVNQHYNYNNLYVLLVLRVWDNQSVIIFIIITIIVMIIIVVIILLLIIIIIIITCRFSEVNKDKSITITHRGMYYYNHSSLLQQIWQQ